MTRTTITCGQHSVLVVTPKPAFLQCIRATAAHQGVAFNDVYFPEEDGVYLVPAIGTFADAAHFTGFVDELKPRLAQREFGKFGIPLELVPEVWTKEVFDNFFDLAMRDRAEVVERHSD